MSFLVLTPFESFVRLHNGARHGHTSTSGRRLYTTFRWETNSLRNWTGRVQAPARQCPDGLDIKYIKTLRYIRFPIDEKHGHVNFLCLKLVKRIEVVRPWPKRLQESGAIRIPWTCLLILPDSFWTLNRLQRGLSLPQSIVTDDVFAPTKFGRLHDCDCSTSSWDRFTPSNVACSASARSWKNP